MAARQHLILIWSVAIIWLVNVATCEDVEHDGNTTKASATGLVPVPIDCMDVLMRCCQADDCSLLRQIQHLFQCAEVLRKLPGEPPYCTRTCRSVISDILATEYGLDLLICNCSRLEEEKVPKISYLCQHFQSNAITKCVHTTPTPSEHVTTPAAATEPVTTRAPTTEHVTTETATTEGVTTRAPTTGHVTTEKATTDGVTTRAPTTGHVTTETATTDGVTTRAPTTETATTGVTTRSPTEMATTGVTTNAKTTEYVTTETATTDIPTLGFADTDIPASGLDDTVLPNGPGDAVLPTNRSDDADIAVSVRNVTARSIVLNFTIEDAVKEFVVKWQRYWDAPEETLRTKRSLVIFGLSPNILYTINITVHLRDGQEKASVVNVSTNDGNKTSVGPNNETNVPTPDDLASDPNQTAVAVSVGKVTETTIALDFAVNEVVERFGVKWKRDQTVPQELPSTNGGLVIGGLSANIVYMFNVTAQLPGGKERSSVVNVSTIELVTTETATAEKITTKAPTTEHVTTETATTERVTTTTTEYVTTETATTEAVTKKASPTEHVTTETATTERVTTKSPTTEYVTTDIATTEEAPTKAPRTEHVTTETATTAYRVTTKAPTTDYVPREPATTEGNTTKVSPTENVTTETATTEIVETNAPTTEYVTTETATTEEVTTKSSPTEHVKTETATTGKKGGVTNKPKQPLRCDDPAAETASGVILC